MNQNYLKRILTQNLNPVEEQKNNSREEIYSEKVKAGKRTYFFDVKSTRNSDYYVTITESKKRFNKDDEGFTYEKHKIFLYKEDFKKFLEALGNTVNHVKELMPDVDFDSFDHREEREALTVEASKPNGETDLKWE
jgi:Protein of unknown function (DUF3276)